LTGWDAINVVPETLVNYFFGTQTALGVGVIILFLLAMLASNIEFKYASLLTLPLVAALVVGGFMGVNSWILNLGLMIAAVIYGTAMVKVIS
jgi:hypothetical protein